VLSDRGLGGAVEALAHRAPLPVELGELPAQELPEQVELTAYLVVSRHISALGGAMAGFRLGSGITGAAVIAELWEGGL
jgi:hypothetical protein